MTKLAVAPLVQGIGEAIQAFRDIFTAMSTIVPLLCRLSHRREL